MVDLAFAAPVLAVVFAVSIIRLKNPLLFAACGELSPPSMPADSMGSFVQSAMGVIGT